MDAYRAERKLLDEIREQLFEIMDTPGGRELMGGMSWGEHAYREQERADARFLEMDEEEWREHLRSDRSQSVEEISRLRYLRENRREREEMPAIPNTPAYWYREYVRYPHLYFRDEAEQKQAIAEVLADWRVSTGRWRVAAMDRSARTIGQWWARRKVPRCALCGAMALEDKSACAYCHQSYWGWLLEETNECC